MANITNVTSAAMLNRVPIPCVILLKISSPTVSSRRTDTLLFESIISIFYQFAYKATKNKPAVSHKITIKDRRPG
jgi:hypothetical protein